MGVQLLFAVETNKKCDSDWIYIKSTIEHFYIVDDSEKKSRAVAFMKKDAIKHIDTRTLNQKQYKTGTSNLMTILDNYLDRKE